jgi:hypothetical protein
VSGSQLRLVDQDFVPEDTEAFCAAQAEVIRALGKRMCGDIIETLLSASGVLVLARNQG